MNCSTAEECHALRVQSLGQWVGVRAPVWLCVVYLNEGTLYRDNGQLESQIFFS